MIRELPNWADEQVNRRSQAALLPPSAVAMASHKKIEYVIFDVDGIYLSHLNQFYDNRSAYAGLMIDSERVYTEVTSN